MLDPQRLPEIQQAIDDAGADAWLFFCFQNNDPVSLDLLGIGGRHLVTRRCYYLVPRSGDRSNSYCCEPRPRRYSFSA